MLSVFPLNEIADVGVNSSSNPKLISREIIVEVFQPVWKIYLNVTDGQTDGRLDVASRDLAMYAYHCVASRSKKCW